MKSFSKSGLILSVAVLLTSVVWANNKAEEPKLLNGTIYTAKGTTDARTATMLVNLLRNPDLKVKADANLPVTSEAIIEGSTNELVYTAHGKINTKTANLLINLLRNPQLKVKAEVWMPAGKPAMTNAFSSQTVKALSISGKTSQKNIKKLKALLDKNENIEINVQPAAGNQQNRYQKLQAYSALATQGKPFYHQGVPPVFIQGKVLWYPVPVQRVSQ